MFDEEYNDYEEYENNDYHDDIKEAAERAREAFIAKAVKENYEHITRKGFSSKDIKEFDAHDLAEVHETINFMIDYFEGQEEYEKCAVLMRVLNAVKNQEDFAPIR